MNHGGLLADQRQHNEHKIIICRNIHSIAAVAGVFLCAICIYRLAHEGRCPITGLATGHRSAGADCDVKIILIIFCRGGNISFIVKVEANNDLFCLVFNGRKASLIYFICRVFPCTGTSGCGIGSGGVGVSSVNSAVAVGVVYIAGIRAVCLVKVTSGGITNTEARRVFNDDPSKHQA